MAQPYHSPHQIHKIPRSQREKSPKVIDILCMHLVIDIGIFSIPQCRIPGSLRECLVVNLEAQAGSHIHSRSHIHSPTHHHIHILTHSAVISHILPIIAHPLCHKSPTSTTHKQLYSISQYNNNNNNNNNMVVSCLVLLWVPPTSQALSHKYQGGQNQ